MSGWDFSVVIIVPASLQDKANRLSCALGYDELPGNTFSVSLSATGLEPITHYGCRTAAKQEFIDIMTGAGGGELPALNLELFDLTTQDITQIISEQILDVSGSENAQVHFNDVLIGCNLIMVGTID